MFDYTVSRPQIPEGAEAAVCYKGKYNRDGGNLNVAEVNVVEYSGNKRLVLGPLGLFWLTLTGNGAMTT
jgi:hypothetical protein